MYKVTVQTLTGNEFDIFFPGNKDYVLTNAVLTFDVGLAGEFNFTIPATNPNYEKIVQNSIITVYKDGVEFWRGDIRDIVTTFDKSLEVYCLEDLAWLGDEPLAMSKVTNQTYSQRFSSAIATYNATQETKRDFTVGQFTAVTSSDLCTWVPEYGMSILDGLRKFIAGENGYLKVRRVTTGGTVTRYIDIIKLSDYGRQSNQDIEFGSNLLDYAKELDATYIVNALYPYGKETETELYDEIMQRISGTAIQNDTSIAAYGRRAKAVVFDTDDLTTLNNLASAYLSRYSQPHVELEVTAVDLGSISAVNDFAIGDSVRVLAPVYAIDQRLYITHIEVNLLDPASNQITLTDVVRNVSLTSQVATQAQEIEDIRTPASVLDEAKNNAWAILEGDNGGIVTFEVNGDEQIIGIHIANNLDLNQATKAWGWNLNGLAYLHRDYATDPWTVGIAMTMDGSIVADYITTGFLSADRINGGQIRTNLITALDTSTVVGNNTLGDFATKASTIVDVDVEYAKNQSSTTAPTTGWSTSSPQWEAGYYIWQRTKTTDGNNTPSYSTPVCIQGADGQQGPTGKGVSAIVEQYYLSTSNVSPTGGSWQNTQPTWEHGKYIWTRSEITWTDTTVTTTTPVLAETANQANEAVYQLDADLDQDGVFNRLIGGDTAQGIVLVNGKLYLRGEYLTAGAISIGGSAYANNPTLSIKDLSNNVIGTWTLNGITANKGQFGSLLSIENNSLYIAGTRLIYDNGVSCSKGFDTVLIINPTNLGITENFTLRVRVNISSGYTYASYGTVGYWTSGGLTSTETINNQIWETTIPCSANEIKYVSFDINPNKRSAISYASITVDTTLAKKTNITADYIASDFRGLFTGTAKLNDLDVDGVIYAKHNNSDGRVTGLRIKHKNYYRYSDITSASINLQDEDSDTYLRIEADISTPQITRNYSSTTEVARWQSSSDERVKENIEPLDMGLSRSIIDYSKPKSFKFKNKDGKHYGMIAQDARELLDSLGEQDAMLEFSQGKLNVEDQRAIDYEEYIPHLINYVKDLRAEIEALKNIIKKEEEN